MPEDMGYGPDACEGGMSEQSAATAAGQRKAQEQNRNGTTPVQKPTEKMTSGGGGPYRE